MTTCTTKPYSLHYRLIQFLDKPRNASASGAQSCNCESAYLSRHTSETMQDRAIVTINILLTLIGSHMRSIKMMSWPWMTHNPGFKGKYLKRCIFHLHIIHLLDLWCNVLLTRGLSAISESLVI